MLKRAIRLTGIDRAIVYSLLNKGAAIVSSVVTLALVVSRLSPARQGYYYTFASLLVLQNLLDLGMGTVLVQFVSHEWSRLRFGETGAVEGDGIAARRVSALVAVALRWYGGVSLAFLVLVGLAGSFLFTRHGGVPEGVMEPWWLLCVAVSVSILQVPLRSVLEGSNQIARVQRIATIATLTGGLVCWAALIGGLELYALALATFATATVGLGWFGRACLPFLRLRLSGERVFSWKREFWPQQWRISVSWMSGYLLYQSFVPILFYIQGPVAAGRMGASLQLYNAINSIAFAWTYTNGPRMGMLGAHGRVLELQALVRSTIVRTVLAAAAMSTVTMTTLWIMHRMNYHSDRFVGLESMAMLLGAVVILQWANVETSAVRFQKIEPFVRNSVVSAALVFCSNIFMAKYVGEFGVCAGFAAILVLITVPWCHRIYLQHLGRRTELYRRPIVQDSD